MTEDELLALYVSMVPGKNMSQRVKALKDMGVDLFNEPARFVEEQFVGTAEPNLVNPWAEAYGRDPKWQKVFGKIESGMDPDSAVDAAIKEGVLPEPGFGDQANNPYDIARQYAVKDAENKAELAAWRSGQSVEAAKFGAKQQRLRSEFEANQPLTMEDLMGVSQLEAYGNPSVRELSDLRAQQRTDQLNRLAAGRRERLGEPVVTPMGANLNTGTFKEIRAVDPLANSPKARAAYERGLAAKRAQMAATRLPTDRTEKAMRNLAMMRAFGV